MITAQSFIPAYKFANAFRHFVKRRRFFRHHVFIKGRWTADGLACIVKNEVESIAGCQHLAAKCLYAWRMTQVEPIDFEPISPFGEVLFTGIARRRIARESSGDDEPGTRAQQFDPGLIPDLDAPAR